jgi:hypothetical protein
MSEMNFPRSFVRAATVRWGDDAGAILKGFISSLNDGLAAHEMAAERYLRQVTGTGAFVQEKGLVGQIYSRDGGMTKPVCDFVAKARGSEGLVLLESKSKLDSAALKKGSTVAEKFDGTIKELHRFYREAREPLPTISQVILTCTKVNVSGNSRWGVSDGLLTFEGRAVRIASAPLTISVVELG